MGIIRYIFVLILNNGFNGEGALYICCGLAIFFNYLNIDWIYQGLEEYGYITGRSVVIKCISLALLVVFVKTREDYVAYIVDYVVNVRDAERFAKLVKSNSVMGFAKFISLALDDWPESDVFQKIAITPPDEELNDSEYYLGLMSRISAIKDIAAVEDVLLEREPIFQRYELELWRRIAIVLTDRGDIRRLYNSGLKYIRFLKEISEKVTIRDEAVDAIEAYCVGLHNAEAVDEYQIALLWGQFYALRGMEGALSSVRPRI